MTDEISGIENRTPQEVFDIMSARIEAQAAQIERLRYELRCIFSDYRGCMDHEWVADVLAALEETE